MEWNGAKGAALSVLTACGAVLSRLQIGPGLHRNQSTSTLAARVEMAGTALQFTNILQSSAQLCRLLRVNKSQHPTRLRGSIIHLDATDDVV